LIEKYVIRTYNTSWESNET